MSPHLNATTAHPSPCLRSEPASRLIQSQHFVLGEYSTSMRFLFRAAIVLMALLSAAQASTLARKSFEDMKRSPHNLAQACRGEFAVLCDGVYADRNDCLSTNMGSIENPQCQSWLAARAVCADFVIRSPDSPCVQLDLEATDIGRHRLRSCIRKADTGKLPKICLESDYYRSLYTHKPRAGVQVA